MRDRYRNRILVPRHPRAEIARRGIVYISHRMKEIFEICDDVPFFVTDNLLLSVKWHH